jgi:NADH:ubiquinone oxidoreductase subunit F (NADH-binding)/(2Fe-2S) ferredoxin/NAD-dependent dihydropyrimidine dehydrogenase PreA subunit
MSNKIPQILVGMGSCGLAAGAKPVYAALKAGLERQGIKARLVQTGCIGMCSREVLVDVILPGRARVTYGEVKPEDVPQIIDQHLVRGEVVAGRALLQVPQNGDKPYEDIPFRDQVPFYAKQKRMVLSHCGTLDPEDIEQYLAVGSYQALKKVLAEMSPEQVIDEVKTSGLRGRGGAGFPTGMKWQFCRQAAGNEKYIICNADEGDPGAFMDRSVLEGDPHAVLEGMIIGAYAIGAGSGYIYCRAEYPLAVKRLHIAMDQARRHGFLGQNILGSGFSFDIQLKEGAGAFVCGEETALMASIEGNRGMPRPRPPFPAQSGLWGKPTNINNVETWANIPAIILKGGEWFAGLGTEKSKGTKVFALTGKIKNTGLIEVPMGITLREVITEIGGGIPRRKRFKAAQLGGPSGGCIPAELMDVPIDYDSLVSAGAIMGSGGIVVMDSSTCMVDMARYFLTFTQNESCGKCVPCRIGTKRMLEMLQRITKGEGEEGDLERLQEMGELIKRTSLCGLGQTAPNPVLSTIRYFREEYEAHIQDKKCPVGYCSALIRFTVNADLCKYCGLCVKACPSDAVTGGAKKVPAQIDKDKCIKCRACIEACPFTAIY